MAVIADILSWLAILVGSAFLLIGSLGLLRLPDFYTRLHAAGVIDTLGAELMLLGMMFQAGFSFVTIKLVLIGAFIFITSPTATHAIANAAYTAGLRPQVK
ncbi:MAG: monovalent cation/H(+) antiporter subunit G, partial [Kiloniellales bacterium]|nr:monovalent cation/H(+) antiporter subunit G [Kiloniellales bacterium]